MSEIRESTGEPYYDGPRAGPAAQFAGGVDGPINGDSISIDKLAPDELHWATSRGVDGSKLAPSPTQLIEQLQERVAALETRVAELEARGPGEADHYRLYGESP